MPTIGWFEILIVVAIAIVVLGPHYGNGAVYSINFIYRAET